MHLVGHTRTHRYILGDLMHVPKGDAAVPPRRLRSKRYQNTALLDRQGANLFPRLVSARYEKGSIILTWSEHVRD